MEVTEQSEDIGVPSISLGSIPALPALLQEVADLQQDVSRKGGGTPKKVWNEGPVSGLWEIDLELRDTGKRNTGVQTTSSCGLRAFQRPMHDSVECIQKILKSVGVGVSGTDSITPYRIFSTSTQKAWLKKDGQKPGTPG